MARPRPEEAPIVRATFPWRRGGGEDMFFQSRNGSGERGEREGFSGIDSAVEMQSICEASRFNEVLLL